jgi:hypothetical protein
MKTSNLRWRGWNGRIDRRREWVIAQRSLWFSGPSQPPGAPTGCDRLDSRCAAARLTLASRFTFRVSRSRPFRATTCLRRTNPGRCPGLMNDALSGLLFACWLDPQGSAALPPGLSNDARTGLRRSLRDTLKAAMNRTHSGKLMPRLCLAGASG